MRVKYKPWAVQYLVDHPEVAKEKFDPNDDFFKAPKIALEIGSGKGDFILTLAKRNPDTHYVSVEVIRSVAGVLAKKIVDNKMDNILLYPVDVEYLFEAIPDGFFDVIYLNFSDPWPKKKHAARRFVNPDNLNQLSRLLKKGGILQIATDHQVYKRWVMEQMRQRSDFVWTAKCSDDWRNPPADWHETKYQRKAVREGRRPVFFEYRKLV